MDKIKKITESINSSFSELPQTKSSEPEPELLQVLTANERIERAKLQAIPNALFSDIWLEGQICILFADTGVGKTILSVQIADSISKGEPIQGFDMGAEPQKVLYFDFELNDKQFEKRYCADGWGNHYQFSDNLFMVNIDSNGFMPSGFKDFGEYALDKMEKEIIKTGVRIIVVDNLTYLRHDNEKAKEAAELIMKLKRLKQKHNLSLLILTHTPKRNPFEPISINNLAGSKMIANFVDSAFSIGKSAQNADLRYIKNCKARDSKDSDFIQVCRIEKSNILRFVWIGKAYENEHIKQRGKTSKKELSEIATELRNEGKSLRQIAEITGKSHQTISRLLNPKTGESTADEEDF